MGADSNNSSSSSWSGKLAFYQGVFNSLPPLLLVLGLASNACAFLVLLRPRMRSMVVHLPLLALSVVDSVALLTGLLRHWLRKATYFAALGDLDPQSGSNAGCKLLELLLYLSLMYSSWLVTLVSVERFVTVCVGPQSRARAFLISRRGLIVTMATGFVCLLAVNLHFLATRGLVPAADRPGNGSDGVTGTPECRNLCRHDFFVEAVFPKLDLTLTAFVPFVVIAACNLRIVSKLRRVRKQSSLSASQSAVAGYRTTVMLLLTTFVFIVLTSPVKIYLTVIGGTQPHQLDPAADPEQFYSHRVAWSILLILQFSNHCCNFLLYCASNPQFRAEAAAMFAGSCCCCCRRDTDYRNQRALTYLRPERSLEDRDVACVGGGGCEEDDSCSDQAGNSQQQESAAVAAAGADDGVTSGSEQLPSCSSEQTIIRSPMQKRPTAATTSSSKWK